jgi:DNA-binding transcriptional LysR family regulator
MMSDYVSTVVMPRVLQRLAQEAPGVTVELLGNDEEPWESLSQGEIDFLVLPKNFVRADHPSQKFFDDEYVCVCWSGNTAVGDEISLEQCMSMGHVVTRLGSQRPPTIDAWFFQRFGHERRVDVIATTFGSVPHMLVGTHRLAIMHRRLACVYRDMMPLKILPVPVEMPRLVELLQWHKYRDRDPARVWMTQVLISSVPSVDAA